MSEPRLSIIPGWIVTDPRLKGKDLQVLCMLGRNANTRHGWCRRSQVQLAKALDCSRSTVQAAINRLVDIGALERREVVSSSGRDSAHWYRVIYDSKVESSAFDAWDAEDEKEFDPTSDFGSDAPPAGIPAPPADPESAPPAGSGPAPINASTLTPPDKREERERERGSENQEEDPAVIERGFKRFFHGWKTAISDSEPDARRVWLMLSAEKRAKAEAKSADYQAAALSTGRKHLCSAATYLREERWEKLQETTAAAASAAPEAYSAYSRAGRGLLLAELMRPERYLQLTILEEVIVRDKPEKRDLIWRDKREKQGWPEAVRLIETTVQRRKFNVPQRIVDASQGFDKVKVGGEVWEAWKRLHHARCWPWLPAPDGLEWMQFPRLSPDIEDIDEACEHALSDFKNAIGMERDNDDAA
ncbi:helix-turn-helix domain-containing protein [Rhizobium sp. S96]|uniref:helix-turn-helix domain-containing protein n=1 Tax=Rhizobium sp. S96 TaxID=3055140 RepID=UPI0025AA5CC4|nr:helix-turn-helix domain-containing protein [Rhizobium sp. S96]MDM9619093.1 helix-turn-helix domain-containing protein [Rhizobium sp. S96]